MSETTNGENTVEQETPPAPTGTKHFKPVGPDWVYNPRAPLNYRPRGAQQEFVIALIKELGTQQLALDRCVVLAMSSKSDEATEMLKLQMLINALERNGVKVKWTGEYWSPEKFELPITKGSDGKQTKEIERLRKLLRDMEHDLSVSQKEVLNLKEKVPAVADAFIPVGTALDLLKKIMSKKKHTSIEDSILYAIAFTSKNDWL